MTKKVRETLVGKFLGNGLEWLDAILKLVREFRDFFAGGEIPLIVDFDSEHIRFLHSGGNGELPYGGFTTWVNLKQGVWFKGKYYCKAHTDFRLYPYYEGECVNPTVEMLKSSSGELIEFIPWDVGTFYKLVGDLRKKQVESLLPVVKKTVLEEYKF